MKINFPNLIRQLLPPHKRQPTRLTWLQGCIAPLQGLFNGFDAWRSNTRMMINVNSQIKIFESYLQIKYKEPIAIKIVSYDDGLLSVSLESEGATQQPEIGLSSETIHKPIPLVGEIRERFGDTDFLVYVPQNIDLNLIRAEIEKYKQALIKYKIIQN
ncbi:MAG: hypothetical protein RR328_04705 [Bacteroidales bacterium]